MPDRDDLLVGQIGNPIVHKPTTPLEQVRTPIGCLDPVLDDVRQGCLDDLAGMIRLFGRPVPEARAKPQLASIGAEMERLRSSSYSFRGKAPVTFRRIAVYGWITGILSGDGGQGRESEFLSSNRIVPVFEPTTRSNLSRFRTIAENQVKFAIIVNSDNGAPPPALPDTIEMINGLESHAPGMVLPAFEIRAGRPISDVQDFAHKFASRQCVIVHRNHTHSTMALKKALAPFDRDAVQIFLDGGVPFQVVESLPAAGKVLLRDGFSRCARNSDYPARSNFDDLLFNYKDRGFHGFSDFSIVGDLYSPGGGPAIQVAIHLTECLDDTTIVTNHFVSRTPPQIR